MMRRSIATAAAVLFALSVVVHGQQPVPKGQARGPEGAAGAVTAAQLAEAIEKLGTIEFAVRTSASRTVRRADPALAVPALRQAARRHADGYVRYRALVLLSGFNDPGTREVMVEALGEKNDRLRTVAYAYFEDNPDPAILPRLLDALGREESEFVRPALTRALAAHGSDPSAPAARASANARAGAPGGGAPGAANKVRPVMTALVMKGHAFFRSIVIEALGDYRAAYAMKPITDVANIDGPLQDDAALALGKIGDKAALPTLAALQRTAPRESQPAIAAAICLLGVNCESHGPFVENSLRFAADNPGFQELLRGSAAALGVLAISGRQDAAVQLIVQGGPARDPARAAIALALGTVAVRNTPLILQVLEQDGMLEPGAALLHEAFDMLEEDYEEERFFATVRRAFWRAPEGSAARRVAETLVQKLEF